MPLYVGDYLGDTMNLSTEQHGAYVRMILHLWRRDTLPNDDKQLAFVTGFTLKKWRESKPILRVFFCITETTWTHKRVDRERARISQMYATNAERAKRGAEARWAPHRAQKALDAKRMLGDATPPPHINTPPKTETSAEAKANTEDASERPAGDPRHMPFRWALSRYWERKNPATPDLPFSGRDGKELNNMLEANPRMTLPQFETLLDNRARSAVAHGDRVYLWIGNVTRFQEPITMFNKPASAGGGTYASRAEINRDAVYNAFEGALRMHRAGDGIPVDAGDEPADIPEPRVPAADGAGPGGRALALAGTGDSWVEEGEPEDGPPFRDG